MLLGAFYAVILQPWGDLEFYRYLRANAWLANEILRSLGQDTHLADVTIRGANFAISIRRGCDALEPAWFFCAAVLAFPSPWRRKPAALLVGAGAILALNFVRILSLYFIGCRLPGLYATAHLELWPAGFILFAAALWIFWIRANIAFNRANSNVIA